MSKFLCSPPMEKKNVSPKILFKDFHPMQEICAMKLTIIIIHPVLSLSCLLFIGINQCLSLKINILKNLHVINHSMLIQKHKSNPTKSK